MEIRYTKPFFSSLKLVLFPGFSQVAVQDDQGRQGQQKVADKPQISTSITGWINNQIVRSDYFIYDDESTPTKDEILEQAKTLGADVVAAWNGAFDQVAELFPQTADQPAGSQVNGPAVFLRADAFEANLHPTQKKSIKIKVGVYANEDYDKVQTYLELLFVDGDTRRERDKNKAELQSAIKQIELQVDVTGQLLVARTNGTAVPVIEGFQYNEVALKQTVAELTTSLKGFEAELVMRQKQIAEITKVLTGDLGTLLGSTTALHLSVMNSVGALCTAILVTLKTVHPDYKNVDVAKIMSEFAIPDIS